MSDNILELDIAREIPNRIPALTYSLTSPNTDVRVGLPTEQSRYGPAGVQIFVFSTTGLRSDRTDNGKGIDRPGVQIRIRAPRSDPYKGRIYAHQLAEAFSHYPPEGWKLTITEGKGLNELGSNTSGAAEWSINITGMRRRCPRAVYYGAAATAPTDDAAIKALDASQPRPNRFISFNVTVAAGENVYACWPTDSGDTPQFEVDGEPFTSFTETDDAVPVVTQLGNDTYRVWELTGIAAGPHVVAIL